VSAFHASVLRRVSSKGHAASRHTRPVDETLALLGIDELTLASRGVRMERGRRLATQLVRAHFLDRRAAVGTGSALERRRTRTFGAQSEKYPNAQPPTE
jgi:hypothetical protein